MQSSNIVQPQQKNTIMQLLEKYKLDGRNNKMSLTAGIYMDETGESPILDTVKVAERFLVENQTCKAAFNMTGDVDFHRAVKKVVFPYFTEVEKKEICVIQTLGASGAINLIGQLVNQYAPLSRIWVSNPTWENHEPLLGHHLGGICHYKYVAENNKASVSKIMEDLQYSKPGDYVLFHASCHNPTGIDPDLYQWTELAKFCKDMRLIPIFDFAYQGFAYDLEKDTEVFGIFKQNVDDFIVCNSFSKNMGLYDERVGALSFIFTDQEKTNSWLQTTKRLIRSSYSIPPIHGGAVASHIINNDLLFKQWGEEVSGMRKDLERRRSDFFSALDCVGMKEDILDFDKQNGMFVCLKLTEEEIGTLREKYGIYMLDSGRISIASLNSKKIPMLCEAIKKLRV